MGGATPGGLTRLEEGLPTWSLVEMLGRDGADVAGCIGELLTDKLSTMLEGERARLRASQRARQHVSSICYTSVVFCCEVCCCSRYRINIGFT